jgi:Glycosyltransferase like family 2
MEALSGPVQPAGAARPRRGGPVLDASIVVPVNAQGDLENVLVLLDDLGRYAGRHIFEVVLVVNNFPPGEPPAGIAALEAGGARVVALPSVREPGVAVALSARMVGMRAAVSDCVIHFDADCRVPSPTPLLDWYVERLRAGDRVAYTPVRFHGLRRRASVFARIAAHHAARWVKRVVLRIPATRGSNYAVHAPTLLGLWEEGLVADEMNVGPAAKARGHRVAYHGGRRMAVLTSGRMFAGGWRKLYRYLRYRLRYNVRVLPVRPGVAARTGRERDPVRVYRANRPVR